MQSTQIQNEDELYQEYLSQVYQHTHGYQSYSPFEHQQMASEHVCVTYGELLYPSVKKIINKMQLSSKEVFLDLGSGLSKCAIQVFMQSEVQKVIAIEASKPLHEQAQKVLQQVKTDFEFYWEDNRSLIQLCDNFLSCDWQDANAIYSCSTCFSQELLIAIGNKINQTPQIQKVMSLRPLPTLNMPLKTVFGVECSWDSALCFYYQKNNH